MSGKAERYMPMAAGRGDENVTMFETFDDG
jgi:hypothetical protein